MESSDFKKLAIEFLRLFALTWKNLWLYSEYHPLGKSSLKKCFDTLHLILNDRGEFSVGTAEDRILAEEILIDEEKYVMASIAQEFSSRDIFSLVFHRGVRREDLKFLFGILIIRPEQLKKMGGLANLIEQRNIKFIQSNTVKFGKITESQELVDIALAEHILTGAKVNSSTAAPVSSRNQKTDSRPLSGVSPALPEAFSLDELSKDPARISSLFAKTLEHVQFESKGGSATNEDILSALRHLGRILQEQAGGQWNKLRIIFARLLLSLKPEIQKFVIEQGHSDSIKDSFLKSFVSYLPEERFGDLIVSQFGAGLREPKDLANFISRLLPSKEKRDRIFPAVKEKLCSAGASDEIVEQIHEELDWFHLTLHEKIQRLLAGELIWKKTFQAVMEIIEEASQASSKDQAMPLIQKYLSGLIHPSHDVRKAVIDNAIPIYIFMKNHPDFAHQRFHLQNLFFRRLKDEQHLELFEDLVKSIMATAASEIDAGDYSESVMILGKFKNGISEDFKNDPRKREILTAEISQMASDDFLKNVLEEHLASTGEWEAILPKFFEIFGKASVPFLIERLGAEKNRKKRYKISALLKSMKQKAFPQLLHYLEDERWYLVRNVIFIIGEIGNSTTIQFLKKPLQHPDHKVRRETVRALHKIGGDEAWAFITETMSDPDSSVAVTATELLGTVHYPKAIKKMFLIASREKPFEEASNLLRKTAIENLGKLKVAEAAPHCIQIIKKRSLLGAKEDSDIRRAAVQALAEIGGEQAREALIYASEKDPLPSIRKMARDAILEG
jgi:HEAT repeat protein